MTDARPQIAESIESLCWMAYYLAEYTYPDASEQAHLLTAALWLQRASAHLQHAPNAHQIPKNLDMRIPSA